MFGCDVGSGDRLEEPLPFRTEDIVALDDGDQSTVVRYVCKQVVQTPDSLRRFGGGESRERVGLRAPERTDLDRKRLPVFTSLITQGLEEPTEPTPSRGARRNADRDQ